MNADNRKTARGRLDALRESEQMYRSFVERSNDGIVLLQDFLIKFVNPRFCEMSGYSEETLIGTRFTNYLMPHEIASLARRYETRIAGKQTQAIYETIMTRRNGGKIPLEISAAVVPFDNRPADLVLVRDTSERKLAEEYLQRYRLLSETTGDMVLFLRLDGTIVDANEAALNVHGFTRDEFLCSSIFDLVPSAKKDSLSNYLEMALKRSITFDATHQHKDGSKFPVEVTVSSATVGEQPLVLAIARDITERVRAKEAVEQSLEETKRQSRRAEALERISETGLELPRLPDLLDAMAERIAKALDVDASCIFALDDKTQDFVVNASYNVPGVLGHRVHRGDGLIGKVAVESRPVFVLDVDSSPLKSELCATRYAAKSVLGVPMIARDKTIGVVHIQSKVIRRFTEDEIRLLQALADRAAMAIDNAQLYENLQNNRLELQQALEVERRFCVLLQRALLPPTPFVTEDYDVAVRYVPVLSGREVGGDFYDVFRASDGWAGVMVGDVSGKGLEAASLAATTRSTVHAFVHEVAQTDEALSRANSVLYSQQPGVESFVTVCLITLDVATGSLRYSSAGHPPPAMLGADGSIRFLKITDLPIGVVPSHEYHMNRDRIERGEKLILYTDGISEAHTNGGMFDTQGIERTLLGHNRSGVDEIADRLIAAATEWADGKLRDDAAVVVVERKTAAPISCRGKAGEY